MDKDIAAVKLESMNVRNDRRCYQKYEQEPRSSRNLIFECALT